MENDNHRPILSKLIILLLVIILVVIYARYLGVKGLKTREYNISSSNIPENFDGFSIVQFSDLLYGSTVGKEELASVVKTINSLNPNIVVFTGDLFSEKIKVSDKEIAIVKSALKSIDAEIGKYSIRGDRDVKNKHYEEIISESDFKDISNTYELIYYKGLVPIVMYGLDSSINGVQDIASAFSYPSIDTPSEFMATYRILIAHEPDTVQKVGKYNVSLMLSGHSLNSSINIPYIKDLYNIRGASSYYDEKYNVNGIKLYISSGIGTNKYNMRLFSKPSISIFRLFHE